MLDGYTVEKDRHRRSVEGIKHKSRMSMWKNVSRRTTSCLMDTLLRRTGIGGVSKV